MTIDSIAIVAKCSDGECRQIMIDTTTEQCVLDSIVAVEGKIRLLNKTLEGVEIIKTLEDEQ